MPEGCSIAPLPDNPVAMLPRFYAPDLDPASPRVTLPADEAHHLSRVLRLASGDEVAVFDGRGNEFHAVVESAARDAVTLRLAARAVVPSSPAVRIAVVQAVLKGGSMDDAVRDATMLGAESIEPLLTAHTDVKPSFATRPATLERWRRIALASAKQSRRATLPLVLEPRSFDAWIQTPSAEMVLMFVEPAAATEAKPLRDLVDHMVPPRAAVLLGPEGGWAAEELERAKLAGCRLVTVGPLTLRAESMAVAAMAALTAIWER